MRLTFLLLGLVSCSIPVSMATATTRSQSEATNPPTEEVAFQVPADAEQAAAIDKGELAKALEDLEPEAIRTILASWIVLLERVQGDYVQATESGGSTTDSPELMSLASDRDHLLARADQTLAALLASGGQAEDAAETIDRIREAAYASVDESTVPVNQTTAQALDIEVLKALLRPMTLEQAQSQLDLWLALLQDKCLEVRNAEVAALRSEDGDEIESINARAVSLRAERGRLIDRTKIVLETVDEKGGEVDVAQAYVRSVVHRPPITGARAAWTTTLAWLSNPDGGLTLARRLGMSLAVLIVSWMLARLLARLARRTLRRLPNASNLLKEFVVQSVRRVVLVLGLFMAFGQLGMNMGPWIAAIGAAGLVVGLALQGTLSNFASGILIMIYRPFDVGDVIATDGPTGKVAGMTLVTTTIKTFDNQTIHVPNNMVWGGVITNITANTTRRVDMVFGVGYGDDADQAAEVLLGILKSHAKVLPDPEPVVRLHELGDSAVKFIVRPWVRTEDYWDVYWDVTREAKRRFDAEGISIPFPQRDVHLIPAPAAATGESEPSKWVAPSKSTLPRGRDAVPAEEEAQQV